jgi:hypothetical protein
MHARSTGRGRGPQPDGVTVYVLNVDRYRGLIVSLEEPPMHITGIRWSSLILGLICLAVGIVWALQGAGLIAGSFMTRQLLWTGIGSVVALVGLVLAYRGLIGRPKRA